MRGFAARSIMALALLVTPGAVAAATVTVDFEGGAIDASSLPDEEGPVVGLYQEAGFDVGFSLINANYDYLYEDDPSVLAGQIDPNAELTTIVGSGGFGCGGCGSTTNSELRFSRADGGLFDLEAIGRVTSSSTAPVILFYYPPGPNGEPDYDNAVLAEINLIYDDLSLTGTRADGSVVFATFATALEAPGPLVAPAFTDLTVRTDGIDLDSLDESIKQADIDPVLGLLAEGCSSLFDPVGCAVPGVGFFGMDLSAITPDFPAPFTVDDFAFDVAAPIPLPASVRMLGVGLASLGLAARGLRSLGLRD